MVTVAAPQGRSVDPAVPWQAVNSMKVLSGTDGIDLL